MQINVPFLFGLNPIPETETPEPSTDIVFSLNLEQVQVQAQAQPAILSEPLSDDIKIQTDTLSETTSETSVTPVTSETTEPSVALAEFFNFFVPMMPLEIHDAQLVMQDVKPTSVDASVEVVVETEKRLNTLKLSQSTAFTQPETEATIMKAPVDDTEQLPRLSIDKSTVQSTVKLAEIITAQPMVKPIVQLSAEPTVLPTVQFTLEPTVQAIIVPPQQTTEVLSEPPIQVSIQTAVESPPLPIIQESKVDTIPRTTTTTATAPIAAPLISNQFKMMPQTINVKSENIQNLNTEESILKTEVQPELVSPKPVNFSIESQVPILNKTTEDKNADAAPLISAESESLPKEGLVLNTAKNIQINFENKSQTKAPVIEQAPVEHQNFEAPGQIHKATLKVNHQEMGVVSAHIEIIEQKSTVTMTVESQDAKNLLQGHVSHLKEVFDSADMVLSQFNVGQESSREQKKHLTDEKASGQMREGSEVGATKLSATTDQKNSQLIVDTYA